MDFFIDYYYYYRYLFTDEDIKHKQIMIQDNIKCFIISTSFTWMYFWSKIIQLRPTIIIKKSILFGFLISTFQASYYGTSKLDKYQYLQQK